MSRYVVEETDDGFVVKGSPHPLDTPDQPEWLVELAYEQIGGRRGPAIICFGPYGLTLQPSHQRYSFCEYRRLLADIVGILMAGWIRPRVVETEDAESHSPRRLVEWVRQRTAWAINSLVNRQWKQLLAKVDPTVLAVHKAVFAATFGYGPAPMLFKPDLYTNKFVVKDILSYRAAAIAARICDGMVETMVDWRCLYCPLGMQPNGALNKTLDNLPGGVPAKLLMRLGNFVLPRAYSSRLELITTILGANDRNKFKVMAFSSAAEIAEAMQRVSRYQHEEYHPRRWRDVATVVRFLQDFPDRHTGNIVGLADKSICWHRDCQQEEIQKTIRELGESTSLALPPVPLPQKDGVRFLQTVGDICKEAEEMGHCIASYAKKAVRGECYLFHVEREGEGASVEVSPKGYVVQSQGKKNHQNKATAWGKKVLTQWGKPLRTCTASEAATTEEQPGHLGDFLDELRRL